MSTDKLLMGTPCPQPSHLLPRTRLASGYVYSCAAHETDPAVGQGPNLLVLAVLDDSQPPPGFAGRVLLKRSVDEKFVHKPFNFDFKDECT